MIINGLVVILCCIGVFFFTVGTVGIWRLPDFYCRLHAATKCDTLGAGSILVALALYERLSFDGLKLLLVGFFLLISSSTVGHALSRAAYLTKLIPWREEGTDESN
jgi:multicomponent Na+:H+ antiporter subunit G